MASLPPSGGVIVSVDESDHQFQSQSLQIDSTSMAGVPESRTHESTGRLIYTFAVHSASLFVPVNRCVVLSPVAGAHINHRSAHLILSPSSSGRDGEQHQPQPELSFFCVCSDASVIDNRVIFSWWGRRRKTPETRANNLIQ